MFIMILYSVVNVKSPITKGHPLPGGLSYVEMAGIEPASYGYCLLVLL